jgi:hypothetical protein
MFYKMVIIMCLISQSISIYYFVDESFDTNETFENNDKINKDYYMLLILIVSSIYLIDICVTYLIGDIYKHYIYWIIVVIIQYKYNYLISFILEIIVTTIFFGYGVSIIKYCIGFD